MNQRQVLVSQPETAKLGRLRANGGTGIAGVGAKVAAAAHASASGGRSARSLHIGVKAVVSVHAGSPFGLSSIYSMPKGE